MENKSMEGTYNDYPATGWNQDISRDEIIMQDLRLVNASQNRQGRVSHADGKIVEANMFHIRKVLEK